MPIRARLITGACATVLGAVLALPWAAEPGPATRPSPASPVSDGLLHISDVCRLRLERGQLVLHTKYTSPADAPRGAASVQIEELGRCTLTVRPSADGSDIPQQFFFYITSRGPDALLIRTHITAGDATAVRGGLHIRRQVQTGDGWSIIALSQGQNNNPGFPGESQSSVVLTVSDSREPENAITRSAPDWKTLRQQFGPDVDQYLRPIFNDLRQYSLFAIEPVVAWQVFSDEWKPDPTLSRRIAAHVPGLAAERFADRAAAAEALRNEGVDGALLLRRIDRAGLTLEQRSAIDAILAEYTFVEPIEAAHNASDVGFLLDCLYCTDVAARRVAAARLAAKTGHPIDFDADAPEELREAAATALRAALLPTTRPTTNPSIDHATLLIR